MWYQRPPEERQAVVRARQAEMRADASYVRQTTQPTESRRVGRVSGLQLHLGRLLIVVGRSLREEETPCPDPMS
jgi:hypothetical protein